MASRRLSVWPARSLRSLLAHPSPGRLKSEDGRLRRTRRGVPPNVKAPVPRGEREAADDGPFWDTRATHVDDRWT
jgi:hypothetical protein